jgi:hypothetical protein
MENPMKDVKKIALKGGDFKRCFCTDMITGYSVEGQFI